MLFRNFSHKEGVEATSFQPFDSIDEDGTFKFGSDFKKRKKNKSF
jgi:hypothetical protein